MSELIAQGKSKRTEEWWNERIPRILLAVKAGHNIQEIAEKFGTDRSVLSGVLYRRGISVNLVRHAHKNDKVYKSNKGKFWG